MVSCNLVDFTLQQKQVDSNPDGLRREWKTSSEAMPGTTTMRALDLTGWSVSLLKVVTRNRSRQSKIRACCPQHSKRMPVKPRHEVNRAENAVADSIANLDYNLAPARPPSSVYDEKPKTPRAMSNHDATIVHVRPRKAINQPCPEIRRLLDPHCDRVLRRPSPLPPLDVDGSSSAFSCLQHKGEG